MLDRVVRCFCTVVAGNRDYGVRRLGPLLLHPLMMSTPDESWIKAEALAAKSIASLLDVPEKTNGKGDHHP